MESAGFDFGFDAAAADGAEGLAGREDEHEGTGFLGGAAGCFGEKAGGDGLAVLGMVEDGVDEVEHMRSSTVNCRFLRGAKRGFGGWF